MATRVKSSGGILFAGDFLEKICYPKNLMEMNSEDLIYDSNLLIRRVDIKTPADYPKVAGIYFCCRNGFLTCQRLIPDDGTKTYMREVSWYLQPLYKQSDSKNISAEEFLKIKKHSEGMYSPTQYIIRMMEEYHQYVSHFSEINTELLEALEQCLTRIDPKSQDTWDLKAVLVAKAAIKKATR